MDDWSVVISYDEIDGLRSIEMSALSLPYIVKVWEPSKRLLRDRVAKLVVTWLLSANPTRERCIAFEFKKHTG